MKLSWITVCLLLCIAGCLGAEKKNDAPEHILAMENVTVYGEDDVANADTLMLDREQVFGDTDENPIASFGSFITDRFGRVYIGDSQQRMVHIFMPDGRYLGQIGRDGDGPGEFRWVSYLEILDQQLYAYDPNGQKINLFNIGEDPDTLPEYVTDISITPDNWENIPEPGFVNPAFHSLQQNGDFILFSRTSPLLYRQHPDSVGVSKYYRWNTSGQTQPELIFQTREAEHIVTEWFIIPPPFTTKEIITISDDDQIYSADTGEFLIYKHNSDGTYQSAFYYPIERVPLTRDMAVERVGQHEQLKDAARSMDLPDFWPVIRHMFVDDENRLWVSVNTNRQDAHEWWVLEKEGKLLAQFQLPENVTIAKVTGESLYMRETDEDTGLQRVVRYGVEF